MDSALGEIRELAQAAGSVDRRRIRTELVQIACSLEGEDDTLHRFGYLHLQTAVIRLGFQLRLFNWLVEASDGLTTEKLAALTGADTPFLQRILRYLESIGTIQAVSNGVYLANNITKNLSTQVVQAGISHCFETIGPQFQAFPGFFRQNGYREPQDILATVFQDAWQTKLHAFDWFGERPENLDLFNEYMSMRRSPEWSWLTVYPIGRIAHDGDTERPLLVSVGGGKGHQCMQFRARYPELSGRVISQDMGHTVEKASPSNGVELMKHDIFTPQPIKYAKIYHMRGVLHNHPDVKVKFLLENIKEAMDADSVLLLDEVMLPDSNVSAYAAALDLTMMAAFAAKERTRAEWQRLCYDAGLGVCEIWVYNQECYETLIEVRKM